MATFRDGQLIFSVLIFLIVELIQWLASVWGSFLRLIVRPAPDLFLDSMTITLPCIRSCHAKPIRRCLIFFAAQIGPQLTASPLVLIFLFPVTVVVAAELGKYETLAIVAAIVGLLVKDFVFPSDEDTDVSDGPRGVLRSSRISLAAALVLLIVAVFYIYGEGLQVFEPPKELTEQLLDSDSLISYADSYFWKLFVLGFVAFFTSFRIVFFSRAWQVALTCVHGAFSAAIWYAWNPTTPKDSWLYASYLATEVWSARHFLFMLLLLSNITQHSLTNRKRGATEKLLRLRQRSSMGGMTQEGDTSSRDAEALMQNGATERRKQEKFSMVFLGLRAVFEVKWKLVKHGERPMKWYQVWYSSLWDDVIEFTEPVNDASPEDMNELSEGKGPGMEA